MDQQTTAPAGAGLDWLADFADPPAEYRPVPFWSWNEEMEPAEVRRQIGLIDEGGWGGGFVHSRVGLTTEYLGEAWFAAAAAAIDACRERGLKVWLYDEDKWPSGFSGGTVPLADEAFRMKALYARPEGEEPLPGSRRVHAAGGVAVHRWVAPLGHAWFNGTCYADLMDRAAMRRFLDDAYEPYHARFGDDYGGLIAAQFTDEPCTIFRARLPKGAVPYTDALPERFRELHGYDPTPHLHKLFDTAGDDPDAAAFRLHYYRTANDLFEHNFSAQLGDWCREHRIDLTGHYMLEGDVYGQQLWGVKIMPNYRHQGMPGIDCLGRKVDEILTPKQCQSVVNQYAKPRMLSELYGCAGDSFTFADRRWVAHQQLALGVNLLNPHLALYTMAGCRKRDFPQNMFYQQPWWPLNKAVDVPLSRLCVALSRGRYHAEALVLHPQESAFAEWRGVVPEAEGGAALAGGESIAGGVAEFDWTPVPDSAQAAIKRVNDRLHEVMHALLGGQRTFDLGDETILADAARVEGGALVVGQMRYRAVVVPTMRTIRPTTLDLLRQLADAGGAVIRCGEVPALIDGEPGDAAAEFFADAPAVEPGELSARLAGAVPPAVVFDGPTPRQKALVYAHVRDLPDGGRLVFLTNLHRDETFNARAVFPGNWAGAAVLDPDDGTLAPVAAEPTDGGLAVPLSFAPTQAHLLLLTREPADTSGRSLAAPAVAETVPLDDGAGWAVERLDDNALPLDAARWAEGEGGTLSAHAVPVIAIQERLNRLHYDGPLVLRYAFAADASAVSRDVRLVVEHPERYQIRCNDAPLSAGNLPAWRDPRWAQLDLTPHVRAGENVIELACDFRHGDLTRHDNPPGRYGTEIETIYVVGDFAVDAADAGEPPACPLWAAWGQEVPPQRCLAPGSLMLAAPGPLAYGDVTGQGLPFYAGRLRLTRELDLDPARGRPALRADALRAAVAEVTIDGVSVGCLAHHPMHVALPEAAAGRVRLSVTLHGTLRNLLGPLHHPDGDLPSVGPDAFLPGWPEGADVADRVARWGAGEVRPKRWRDDYDVVQFGPVPGLRLDYLAR